MAYHYFLSYARLDRDDDPKRCIPRFFEDIDREIRRKLIIKEGRAGFFDTDGVEPGESWPEVLSGALQSCRSLLCLYSRAYFNSIYCGKEWSIFNLRLANYRTGGTLETRSVGLIIPVLYDPPEDLGSLPEGVGDFRYDAGDYPDVYCENGLRYLMVRDSPVLETAYQDFIDALVRRIIHLLEKHNLPPLGEIPDIKVATSFFHRTETATTTVSKSGTTLPGSIGPRHADFVYLAARRDEIKSIKNDSEGYGEEGGLDWRPFWPDLKKEAAMLAQEVATKEGFLYRILPLSDSLDDQVAEAKLKSRIVIILVDAWTLRLEQYRQIVRRYDEFDSWNSAVTVAWNLLDEQTRTEKAELEIAVRVAFITKSRRHKGKYFVDSNTAEELKTSLSILLHRLKMDIIDVSKDLQAIPGNIALPSIFIPSGGTGP